MGRYADKSDAELAFIIKDATEAADCAREMGRQDAESKYRDQVCDAASERYRRQQRVASGSARVERGRGATSQSTRAVA